MLSTIVPVTLLAWFRYPAHWVRHGWADTKITVLAHSDYYRDVWDGLDRWVQWQDKGFPSDSSDGNIHVIRWVAIALEKKGARS